MTTIACQTFNGFGMKVARNPCFSATDFVAEFEEAVLVGSVQHIIKFPVHLELAIGIFMVVLIGPSPARACNRRFLRITS